MADASPPARRETIRASIRAELKKGPLTAKALSARVGISEKEVAGHLEHLARSLAAEGETLETEPAQCLGCGFVFQKRRRFTRPSRCPQCSAERVDPPAFYIPD